MKIARFLAVLLSFTGTAALLPFTSKGLEITTQGTFLNKQQRDRIANILATKPESLLSDIDLAVENKLLKKKKELESALAQKIGKVKKRKTKRSLEKINRMLENRLGYIHEGYIFADNLNELMTKNPAIVHVFRSDEAKTKAAEAEQYVTKKGYAQAFDKLASLVDIITYDRYLQLKEQYKDHPFFKLIHNIRECNDCGISRIEVPFVRKYLEDKVIDYVKAKFPDKNKQIIITDFASGNLFEIFVIVNKLAALGYTNIRLNLIDIAFKDILQRYRAMMPRQSGHKFLIKPGMLELSPEEIDAVSRIYRSPGQIQVAEESPEYAADMLGQTLDLSLFNNTFAYFSQWFNGSGLNLDMVIYGDASDYLADVNANPVLKGDLLIAVDYFTDLDDILNEIRMKGLKETGMAFTLDHADVDETLKHAEFFFSVGGAKQQRMKHFEWDLTTKKLKPIENLPGTLDHYISFAQLADLFKES